MNGAILTTRNRTSRLSTSNLTQDTSNISILTYFSDSSGNLPVKNQITRGTSCIVQEYPVVYPASTACSQSRSPISALGPFGILASGCFSDGQRSLAISATDFSVIAD